MYPLFQLTCVLIRQRTLGRVYEIKLMRLFHIHGVGKDNDLNTVRVQQQNTEYS